MIMQENTINSDWLLFFYTIPTKPVGNRTKIWRRLTRLGAIKLKGAVYILPYSEEHHEILQWLITELLPLGGDGALVRTATIEPLRPLEIIDLFNNQCIERYQKLHDRFDRLERKIVLHRQSTKSGQGKKLAGQLNKLQKELYTIGKIDFFKSEPGIELEMRIKKLKKEIVQLTEKKQKGGPVKRNSAITICKLKDYQGKTWATRKNPFVDRMASAWLIRKFIDDQAVFSFINDMNPVLVGADHVTFDIRDGDFTHFEDLCTFEVLLISFGLDDKILQQISRIVHDIDLNDDNHRSPEADGVEMILSGIKKSALNDSSGLEKGMDVFEALYVSFT